MGAPSVTSLSTVSGPTTGYIPLTITGSGFAGLAASGAVMFGTTAAASYTVWSSTSITTSSPPEAAGTVRRHRHRQRRHQPQDGRDQFTYSNTTWYQASPPTVPTARDGAAQAYDPATGPDDHVRRLRERYLRQRDVDLDGRHLAPSFSRLPAQALRGFASMAYDSATSQLGSSFGGLNSSGYLATPGVDRD